MATATKPTPKTAAKTAAPAAKPAAKAAPAPKAPKLTPVQQRLAEMKQAYEESKAEAKKPGSGGSGTTLNPGQHICRLTEARLIPQETKISVLFNFQCVEGEETGETGQIWHQIDNPEKLVYFNRDLVRMGVDIDQVDIMDIEQLLAALQEETPAVRLKVKEKGEYINCFIDKLINLDDSGDVIADEPAEEAAEETGEEPVEEEVAEEGEEVAEEEPAEEAGEEVDGEVVEEEVVEEEPIEEWVPSVEDLCKFKEGGKVYKLKIKAVNLKKETADFLFQGKKITKPFADLEKIEA